MRSTILAACSIGATFLALSSPIGLSAQEIEPVEEPFARALESGPLLPEEVMRSSARTFPLILESYEREAAARADELGAAGAFDLILAGKAYDRVSGSFSGGFLEAQIRQPLASMGAELYGSYRLSDGRFPIYENFYNTNELGEFKVGGLLSLLRDRGIDERRFGIEDTRLATKQAGLDIVFVQLKVQHDALAAYWRWVAAGKEIGIYEELLEIAEARAIGLARQVRSGALARVALVENEQNVLKRKILLAEAQRNFEMARNSLSFYLRDLNGRLYVPARNQLPESEILAPLPELAELLGTERNEILVERPELKTLRLALQRAENKIELRRNELLPRLDLNVELSRDFGPIGDGGPTFDSTDTIVGFTFTVPLQRREARGRLSRAESELREIELRERRVADEIQIEIDNIFVNLTTAMRLVELASGEVEQAQAMVTAERKRFRLGAGDFFLVNVREESAADARIRQIRANLNGRLATLSYQAATMNLTMLGLD